MRRRQPNGSRESAARAGLPAEGGGGIADLRARRLSEREAALLVELAVGVHLPASVLAVLYQRTGGEARRIVRALDRVLAGARPVELALVEPDDDQRTAPVPVREHVFRLDGEYWTIAYEGRTVRLRDTSGLRHLAQLLRKPGQRLHVSELVDRGPPTRHVAVNTERARLTVTKGISAALARLTACHPTLGIHLAATIHRGYFCSYTPDPRGAVAWLAD